MSNQHTQLDDEHMHEHNHNHETHEHSHDHEAHQHSFHQGAISHEAHTHVLEDGTIVTHTHDHHHQHTHQNTKAVINRLSRAIGHLEKVKRMVEEGEDCSEVLIQLSAVKSALNNTGKVILKDHLEHCVVDAVKSGDTAEIEAINKAIDTFIK